LGASQDQGRAGRRRPDAGRIDEALERRYTQAFKLGIFDRKLARQPIDFAAGGRKAREIGGRATVLLQNNGALPLRQDLRSIALIGKASQVYAQQAVAGGAVVGEPMGAGGAVPTSCPITRFRPLEGCAARFVIWAMVRRW
jgi:beta-glucosidase